MEHQEETEKRERDVKHDGTEREIGEGNRTDTVEKRVE